jgi:hypothetical protein
MEADAGSESIIRQYELNCHSSNCRYRQSVAIVEVSLTSHHLRSVSHLTSISTASAFLLKQAAIIGAWQKEFVDSSVEREAIWTEMRQ